MSNSSFYTDQKRAALVAGASLLAMALLAPIAYFFVLEPIRTAGDTDAQISALLTSGTMFRVSILIFFTVAVLDILVAWGLHGVFSPLNSHLSLLAAWFRIIYTAVLLVAVVSLVEVLNLLEVADPSSSQWRLLIQHEFSGFYTVFNFGLGVFGFHLIVLGYLIIRTRLLPSLLGGLVMIAGLGYLVDTLGTLMISQYDLGLASFTFVGEVLLIGWLFWWGFKRTVSSSQQLSAAQVGH